MKISNCSIRSGWSAGCESDPGLAIAARFASGFVSLPAGREVYAEGEQSDHLYIVTEGWLFQHQFLKDGRRQILDFALPGMLLGFQPQPGSQMSHTAETLTDATVAIIRRQRIQEIFAFEPEFAMRVVSAAASALNTAYESLTDVGRRTAREAVAHLLLRLSGRICSHFPRIAGASIPFPLKQEQIGDALGLTSVHVCRTLRCLRQENILELHNGTLTILDYSELIEIAGDRSEVIVLPKRMRAARPRTEGLRVAV